jgi:ferric-dicitrate binding protein FerR (iron transport regulator)
LENWDLIGKKLNGELTPEESSRFDDWLRSDASHEVLWKDAQRIWNVTGEIDLSFEADTETALSKIKTIPRPEQIADRKPFFTPLRIAASLVLIVACAFLVSRFIEEKQPAVTAVVNPPVPMPVFVETKMMTMSTTDSAISFFLPDSSHIYLNKNSSLTYPENFSGSIRGVKLSGEAFFDVTPDAQKPFVIEAGNTETRVVGTSFNIREDRTTGKVEVSVVSGKVKFKAMMNADHLSEVTLLPLDKVTYTETSAIMVKHKVKASDGYWWSKNLASIRKLFNNAKKELSKPKSHRKK